MARSHTTRPSPLGRLLLAAMAAKGQATGQRYTYRRWQQEIEELTGQRIVYSHLRNLVAGKVRRVRRDGTVELVDYHPRPDTLAAALTPLRGYIDEDAAWIAAGYAPPTVQEHVARLRALEDALEALRRAPREQRAPQPSGPPREGASPPADAEVAALEQQLQHDLQEAWQTLARLSEALRRRSGQAPTP